MSQRSPQREPQLNSNGRAPVANQLDPWQDDDARHQELGHLTAQNKQLLAQVHSRHGEGDEVEQLRRRVDELENALLERSAGEEDWTERQKEYEALLEEKSEVIRSLHQKIQELRESAMQAP